MWIVPGGLWLPSFGVADIVRAILFYLLLAESIGFWLADAAIA